MPHSRLSRVNKYSWAYNLSTQSAVLCNVDAIKRKKFSKTVVPNGQRDVGKKRHPREFKNVKSKNV